MEVRRRQCAYHRREQVRSPTPLHRRDGDVKLVEHVAVSCDGVLELSGGLRWVRCRVFVNPSISAKMCAKTVTPPRLGWTLMASQNSVRGKWNVFRASALVRPGVVIVARTCKSKRAFNITCVVC